MSLGKTIKGLPSAMIIMLVRFYQLTLSPFFGRQCRFRPTCSNYMIEAVEKYGAIRGFLKGVWRILRCNPFCQGGYDPP
jgi:putative membrane protein insertion efficiency factor